MDKLVLTVAIALMCLGIGVWVLDNDNGGVNGSVIQGHESLKDKLREYNYSTE